MSRLILTLDSDTAIALERHSKRVKQPRAALARELIREAIQLREARDCTRQLARDYSAGRDDSTDLLAELEALQLELLEDVWNNAERRRVRGRFRPLS